MKTRNLLILSALAILLVGAALITSRDKEEKVSLDIIGSPLLPNLDVNDITKMVVQSPQELSTIVKHDGIWCLAENFNHPVDFEKVRRAILSLSEATIGQVIDIDSSQRQALQLTEPPGAETAGTRVTLYDSNDKKAASVLIGKGRERPAETQRFSGDYDGHYVDTGADHGVYLVGKAITDFPLFARYWLNTILLNVQSDNITNITITMPEQEDVILSVNGENKLALPELPRNKEPNDDKIGKIRSALTYLRFDDIADPALTEEQLGMDSASILTAITLKGEIYTLKIGAMTEDGSGRYIRVSGALLGKPAQQEEPQPEQTLEETDEPDKGLESDTSESEQPALELAAEELQKTQERVMLAIEINDLNEALNKWTYIIAPHKVETMLVTKSDLIKEKEDDKDK